MTQALPTVAVPAVSALAAVTPLSGNASPGEGGAAFGRELERATRRSERAEADKPATAATSATPATPATPAAPGKAATPATPASPAKAATSAERSVTERRGTAERTRAHEARDARRAGHGPDADAPGDRLAEAALDATDPAAADEAGEDRAAPAEPGSPADLASLLPQLAERLQAARPAPAPRGASGQPEAEPAAGASLPGLASTAGELARGLVDERLRGLVDDRARGIPQTRLDLAAAAADTAGATGTTGAAAFGALVAEAAQAAASARPAAETARVDALLPPASAGHGIAASQATAAPAPTVTEDRLSAPLGTRDFAQELGARVALFAKGGIEHARLNLNPAELGPIALQLALDGTQLRVDMSAALAATRQALEQALPGLAGALAEAGLTLSGGGVFEQARGEAGNARNGQPGRGRAGADTGPDEAAPAVVTRPVRLDGLVDLYA